VYPYLSTHDNYSLDECLSLCQAAGITDATAYLLERGGDVGGALRLTLRTLRERLVALKVSIGGFAAAATAAPAAATAVVTPGAAAAGGGGGGGGA
ncbi:unnamed protein product, partial [Phaeothamnion confervicola]